MKGLTSAFQNLKGTDTQAWRRKLWPAPEWATLHIQDTVLQAFLDVLEGILGTMMHTLNKGPLYIWLLTRGEEKTEACISL